MEAAKELACKACVDGVALTNSVQGDHAYNVHRDTAATLLHQAQSSHAKIESPKIPGLTSAGLTEAERAGFFDIIEPTMHIGDQEGFFYWTQTKLQRIFPHGKLICGYGLLENDGFHIHTVMGCNFPPEYLQTLQLPGGLTRTPIILKWLSQQQPVLFEPGPDIQANSEHAEWLQNFHRFELRNIAAHGFCDPHSRTGSYFSFSEIQGPLTARHTNLLKLLVPYLHVVLMRILSAVKPASGITRQQPVSLTTRELEVLGWIGTGKTNWEIAQLLGLSEFTVKNHIHRILARLNVKTRAQALTKAINLKLIHANNGKS